jgi:septal ring factor EnvC (AmiA/AmiB activator)
VRRLLLAIALLTSTAGAVDRDAANVALLRAEGELRAATARVRDLEVRIASIEREAAVLAVQRDARGDHMGRRMRALYKARRQGMLPLLLAAETPEDLFVAARSLAFILRDDARQMEAWRQQRDRGAALEGELRAQRDALLRTTGEVAQRREEARLLAESLHAADAPAPVPDGPIVITERIERERPRFPPRLPDERASASVVLDLSEEPEPALATETMQPDARFPRSKGHLPMPAVGPLRRAGRGLAIEAKPGDPIRAVLDGVVADVLWLDGFGNVCIVDHGGGWATVYGHAASIAVARGQPITGGMTLGTVGDTGSLDGTRLHFEVRRGREAEDPLDWLSIPKGVTVTR